MNQTIVEMDAALLFITPAGQGTCLALLADSDADAGQIAYEMAVLVKRVGQHMIASRRSARPGPGPRVGRAMGSQDDRWTQEEAGPVSPSVHGDRRPDPAARYATTSTWSTLSSAVPRGPIPASFDPEPAQILDLCRIPISVAEVAAIIGLPLGVVRVLLDDLLQENLIEVMTAAPRGVVTDQGLLRKVLEGLQAL